MENIRLLVRRQRSVFESEITRPMEFRIRALRRLKKSILENEQALERALKKDLGKSSYESYMSEIGFVLDEISFTIRHLPVWMRCVPAVPSKMQAPARCFRSPAPYGCVLIMSPWNYPFMLTMGPLIGAIAAGNCAIVKPSVYSPNVSAVMGKILRDCFMSGHVDMVSGGRAENASLLEERFDYIFFTGSVDVGRLVMEKAALHLTPVSLELGGKSPCIVHDDADLKMAAKRIVFGKFLNCGQTCVAPDYLLVHEGVKAQLLSEIRREITDQYGENPMENSEYGKIVNRKHFDRLCGLLEGQQLSWGGRTDGHSLKIEPTVVDHVKPGNALMQEEIFGPILPVMTYKNLTQAIRYVNAHEKPLALYIFSKSSQIARRVMHSCNFGGGCINDTILHLATSHMPFGGVGHSGMGGYHGKYSFDTFTHYRSIVKKSGFMDLPMRYHPYTDAKMKLLKKLIR